MKTIYDITPPITQDLAVWPGDTPPTREVLCDIAQGDNITLSTLRATVHLGAHADAPIHYKNGAQTIDERAIERYIGLAQLISVRAKPGERFGMNTLSARPRASRVLLRTNTYPDPVRFNEDFAAPEPALLHELADAGVVTVGVDTPSVDLYTSKDLPSHAACAERDLAILEGLVLQDVADGMYELIALPLKLVGFDASPVRAILRDIDQERSID